jgi:hypothetical protein
MIEIAPIKRAAQAVPAVAAAYINNQWSLPAKQGIDIDKSNGGKFLESGLAPQFGSQNLSRNGNAEFLLNGSFRRWPLIV